MMAFFALGLLVVQAAAQPDICARDLYDLCRHVEHSPKLCYDCLHEHEHELARSRCQRHELQEFCHGGDHQCESALRTDCPNRQDDEECRHCVERHERALLETCPQDALDGYCGADDDPRCTEVLRHECGRLEGKELICDHCTEGAKWLLLKAGCQHDQVYRFCK